MKFSQRADKSQGVWGQFLLLSTLMCVSALASASVCIAADWTIHPEPWPEADRLLRHDSRWRGADAANSIDLGNGRVLWTFGDSFVDTNKDPSQRHRKTAKFIRNSIAIQTGYDPTKAEFRPYWKENADGTPSSFFRPDGDVFYWPGGGLILNDQLLVFLMRIQNNKSRLGFSVVGWGAVLIENPRDDPNIWEMEFMATPQNSYNVMVGSGSSLRVGDWVYSFGAENSRRHKLYLTRILVSDALAGDFANLQWWNATDKDWQRQIEINDQPPQPIIDHGQTEFTVHYEPRIESYLLTQFKGFPRSSITVRAAQKLTGPWSRERAVFLPEEAHASNQDIMVYACKVHPEQATEGIAVTYCTNTLNPARVLTDESLYYPRFVRFIFKRQADESAE